MFASETEQEDNQIETTPPPSDLNLDRLQQNIQMAI
jgi:hypothetical protein